MPGTLSYPQAYNRALNAHPELYAEFVKEVNEAPPVAKRAKPEETDDEDERRRRLAG
jgi:hypothetical protein